MNIAFFELEDWEKEFFTKDFPDAQYLSSTLTPQNVERFANVEAIAVFIYSQITREILDKLPNLKFIATQSTGFDHIDLAAAQEKGITISNVPEYGTRTVSEHTF